MNIAEQLLGNSRSAILGTLLLRPEKPLHVRELARITGISPGTLHRELVALHDMGVISREEIGRQVFYAADRRFPLFEELASMMRKTKGLADVIKATLLPLQDRIEQAFIFGSMAKGDAGPGSDIDLMIIGDIEFADAAIAMAPVQNELRRDINPVVMTRKQYDKNRREKDGFIASVERGKKIWMIDKANDTRKPAQDRPAQS